MLEFDGFSLNTQIAQLSLDGVPIAMEPRVYDLLTFLIENRDRIVSKDEIIEALWQGRFTSDTAITTCIKSLRKALDDDGEKQRYIKTQRGKGFRFVAQVIEQQKESGSQVAPPATPVQPSQQPDIVEVPASQGKPSIIVLPFSSLADNHDDALIAEALPHELIQTLSRMRWLRVIARGTSFRFVSPNIDLREIANQLNVRYALCGSIETIANRKQVSVELCNCHTADVIWAECYDIETEDVQLVRKQIVASIISSLETYIHLHEVNQAMQYHPSNLDAWANYHLGLRHMFRFTREDNQLAAKYFDSAVQLDHQFARAYSGLSFTRFQDAFLKYGNNTEEAVKDARRLAQQGVELDPLDPFTNFNLGRSYWLVGDPDAGLGYLERSVSLSPNFAQGYYSCGFTDMMSSRADSSLLATDKALDLSPLDPLLYAVYSLKGLSYLRLGDMQQACYWAEKGARTPGAHVLIMMISSMIFALSDNPEKAAYWRTQVYQKNPQANRAMFFSAFPFTEPSFREILLDGLKRANFA